MRWRALTGAALITLALSTAPAAHAETVQIGGPWWAQRAVDEMRVPVPPAQTVIISACPGYDASEVAACNFVAPASPIYIDPSPLDTPASLREVLYRELGGRFETLAMYPWAVQHFAALVHRPRLMADAGNAREVFEDAYADCALGLVPRRETLQRSDDRWIDASGYQPSRRRHARVCTLIRRVGAREGLRQPQSDNRDA